MSIFRIKSLTKLTRRDIIFYLKRIGQLKTDDGFCASNSRSPAKQTRKKQIENLFFKK